MKISIQQAGIQSIDRDAIIINLFEGVTTPGGATGVVDKALDGAISELIEAGDLSGKLGNVTVLYPRGAVPADRVVVVGLGKQEDFSLESVREAAAVAIKQVSKLGVSTVATIVHGGGIGDLEVNAAAQAVVEGSLLALYQYPKPAGHKDENSDSPPESLTVVEFDHTKIEAVEAGAKAGQIIAESVYLARTLVNHPSNIITPTGLAEAAQTMAAEVGLRCRVLDEAEMQAQNMNALLAVTKGASEPAKFIILEHQPDLAGQPIVLIGKGVTFDTGGYWLKPTTAQSGMKSDMAGAAAVIGAVRAIALLDLPLHVVGLVPAAENMISDTAYKTEDVYVAKNGVSVEILSTDAEGRLLLADALNYAADLDPAVVIDIATLTSGKVVALGERITAIFASDDALYEALFAAGARVNEPLWRLPLDPRFDRQLKSEVADLKNSGGSQGHPILGGRFLAHFVGDWAWAHLDIAGDALYHGGPTQTRCSYLTKGATGKP
ncbi:MAG: leucyl aminopeptidase, partial [Anaerolineae bacterium]|nr:leucyl aminopeptidase [Anaerolineae bacterium]